MSEVPQTVPTNRLRLRLSRKQVIVGIVPLPLVAGTVFLIWFVRPASPPPSFDQQVRSIEEMKAAQLYPAANAALQSLFKQSNLKADQVCRLHRMMVEVIYAYESGNYEHGASNAKAIIEHSDAILAGGQTGDAVLHQMRAEAWEWLGGNDRAEEEYAKALTLGAANSWEMRKRIFEIQRETGRSTPELQHAQIDAFLSEDGVSDTLRYWAAEQKISLLAEKGKPEEVAAFLAQYANRFTNSAVQDHYVYLQALVQFQMDRLDESERLVRILRDHLVPGHPLYAQAGCLLGKVQQSYQASLSALATYDDVIGKTTPSAYRTLAILGRAETLADVERYDESINAFREVIRLVSETRYGSQVDLQVVRQTMTVLHEKLRAAGRMEESMAYLQLAARLTPPADERLQSVYCRRMADLLFLMGERARERTGKPVVASRPTSEPSGDPVHDYFLSAAEEYLRFSRLKGVDSESSLAAGWKAIQALDEAGERDRQVEAIESFIHRWTDSPRVPEAILRLGQTYQAMGNTKAAIEAYQRNLARYPRTYWASQSVVPLADCFIETGQTEKAEQTLLRVVDRSGDDDLALIEPAAQEYRDALFKLADLYRRTGEQEKAIARYEEAIERYGDDSRSDRVSFLLAEAYRNAAVRIREDLKDPKYAARSDELKLVCRQRLERAGQLFNDLAARLRQQDQATLGDDKRLLLKLSCFYSADLVFERGDMLNSSDPRPYLEAIQKYDEAAWLYQHDPIAMSAYVQIMNCHIRLGNMAEARKVLQRASWVLRNIPDTSFDPSIPERGRKFWEDYLAWLGRMPMLSSDAADEGGFQAQASASRPSAQGS